VAQEKRPQALPSPRFHEFGIFSGSREVAHGFVGFVWHPDSRQFAGAMEPR
jgi:hypothetical protein